MSANGQPPGEQFTATPPLPVLSLGGRIFAAILATTAWVSILPYFLWPHRELALGISAACIGLAVATVTLVGRPVRRPSRLDASAGVLLLLFLAYATLQKTVAGGHVMWIFAAPTVVGLVVATEPERRLALRWFEALFLLSLVPGLILFVLMLCGLPLTFSARPSPNAMFAASGIRVLQSFGAVFIENNSVLLPWGGVLSRLCGMFDEPGTVGTLSALLLAIRGFALRDFRAWMLWLTGICSLSLAFVILVLLGMAARIVFTRRWSTMLPATPVVLAGMLATGMLAPDVTPAAVPAVRVVRAEARPGEPGSPPRSSEPTDPINVGNAGVRQTVDINNRSQPEMDQLVQRYWQSGWKIRVFGLASDASVVYGGASAVWTRVPTNHGLVGLALITSSFGALGLSAIWRTRNHPQVLWFLVAFALSFYQRPVVWMPYTLLLFFGAVAVAAPRAASRPGQAENQDPSDSSDWRG